MKHLFQKSSLLIVGIAFLFSGCVNAQFWGTKGNGNVQKENREVASFNSISASSGLNVYINQGDKEAVSVEADDNLLKLIVTKVKGNELILKTTENIRRAEKLDVYVTLVNVNEIHVSSGCDLESQGLIKADHLDMSVSSGADAKLQIEGNEISCSVSSGADAILSGKANFFYGKSSSGSDLRAKELIATNCKAKASSGGDVSVYAKESIEANASSGGDVSYYGNPTKVDVSSSSGGDVNQR
ncbi:head GIN domain-containing protein [Ancylomarina longa]|uniref:DUF2807 domain-containing protein n=1 Tax=Ancylomarina longa TaxID=2487017 RepID=A0A434AGK1_9BACT|nr:head GIN domain-containing protein [Ancylomarina longa]RUT73453.1 DUF2807 domain-containing protein [Ancylomarina longa]